VETMNTQPASAKPETAPETVVVDCLDSRGRVQLRQRVVLRGSRRMFTIGRSVDADVTLDDEHSAAVHVSVELTPDGRLLARDLGSINGIVVAGERHRAASGLLLEDGILQVGRTRLAVRTSRQTLPPEKPDQHGTASLLRQPAQLAGLGALAVVAQSTYEAWLGAPRDLLGGIVASVGFALLLIGLWVGVWALLSRVMQEEWRWLRHAAIILGIAAVTVSVNGTTDLGWFMFSLPPWNSRGIWIGSIALAAAVSLHLIHAAGLSARRAAAIGCLIPAVLAGGGQWFMVRNNSRDVNHIDADLRIYPPNLRVRKAGTVDDYFAGASALRKSADAKLKNAPADNGEDYE
jgi:FHA domain